MTMLGIFATIAGLLVFAVWMWIENREDKKRIQAECDKWEWWCKRIAQRDQQ